MSFNNISSEILNIQVLRINIIFYINYSYLFYNEKVSYVEETFKNVKNQIIRIEEIFNKLQN